jgi:hypothetical protein
MARLFPYNWILAALITASGIKAALDVANIKIAERGAIIGGYSHSQGGTMINAEKDEVIINKRSAQKFLPELSAINSYRGWGVPFAERGAIIPSMETNRGMTREEAIKLFEGGFNAIKVYVSEREITTIQNRVKATEYESRF